MLAGLHRQAAVALVTPLADGMNLVAKEFVAAQNSSDPGVLVLSKFAGAAEALREASFEPLPAGPPPAPAPTRKILPLVGRSASTRAPAAQSEPGRAMTASR